VWRYTATSKLLFMDELFLGGLFYLMLPKLDLLIEKIARKFLHLSELYGEIIGKDKVSVCRLGGNQIDFMAG